MPRAAGLDIGEAAARAVVIEKTTRGIDLIGFATESRPADVAADPAWARRALSRAGWTGEPIAVAVPPVETTVRPLSVPFTEEAQLTEVVRFEAENYLPFALEEAVVDYIPTAKTADGTQVLAFAARKEAISACLEETAAAGIDPYILSVVPAALLEALNGLARLPDGPSLLLVLDAGCATTLYLDNRQPVYVRIIRTGTDTGRLARELRRTLSALPESDTGKRAILFGELCNTETAQELGTALGLETAPFHLESPETLGGELPERFALEGLTALGLALPLLQEAAYPVNLRQGELRYRPKLEKLRRPLSVALGAWAVLCGILITGIEARRNDLEHVVRLATGKRQAVWETMSPGEPIPTDLGLWTERELQRLRRNARTEFRVAGGSALETLQAIFAALPAGADISIRSIVVRPDGTRVGMVAESHTDAAEIARAVEEFLERPASPQNLRYEVGKSLFELTVNPSEEVRHAR
jgi:hypothetical protein